MYFFSFLVLQGDLLLLSITLPVLPLLSHQLCEGFIGLPYLPFAPHFTLIVIFFPWDWCGLLFWGGG